MLLLLLLVVVLLLLSPRGRVRMGKLLRIELLLYVAREVQRESMGVL